VVPADAGHEGLAKGRPPAAARHSLYGPLSVIESITTCVIGSYWNQLRGLRELVRPAQHLVTLLVRGLGCANGCQQRDLRYGVREPGRAQPPPELDPYVLLGLPVLVLSSQTIPWPCRE
jgi:hypothetical protein